LSEAATNRKNKKIECGGLPAISSWPVKKKDDEMNEKIILKQKNKFQKVRKAPETWKMLESEIVRLSKHPG